jgi:23S rRNA (cytosine1962-C5)-methyltransferase
MTKIKLKPGKDVALLRKHPWIFSGAVSNMPQEIPLEEVVDVYSAKGDFLAKGFWNDGSIAIKVFSFSDIKIDISFWRGVIRNAIKVRKELTVFNNNEYDAYRLMHAEGDGIPGLVIDIFANVAVVQLQAKALNVFLNDIIIALNEEYKSLLKAIYVRKKVEDGHNSEVSCELIYGENSEVIIEEYGVKYYVDIISGQKTGFFLDQRENRKFLRQFVKEKKVLNAFCYTGGFSLSALFADAEHVVSIDISKPAMGLLEKNLILNNFTSKHSAIVSDYFKFVQETTDNFDVIVLDPPAFAKHRKALEAGFKGYVNINEQALRKISKNGFLMTYSCSQLLSRNDFRKAILEAALKAKRDVKIVHELHQAPCHPINLFHPEGEYLKGFVLLVE